MAGPFLPSSSDPAESRRLARLALDARLAVEAESAEWVSNLADRIDSGALPSMLYRPREVVEGLVSWSLESPLGASVQLIAAASPRPAPTQYASLLDAVEQQAGPIAFLQGPLPGLTRDEEEGLLRGRGFRRFARLEMVRDREVSLPTDPLADGETLRAVESTDLDALATLHRAAYGNRFDRYLFLESTDDAEDARREVQQILEGRWGAFAAEGSRLLERNGHVVGAVLAVWGPTGALIADVMVEPSAQGQGVGRRILTAAVLDLERAGAARVYLNVTVGNTSALKLYTRLGFAQSLGPSQGWYSSRRIPVAPSPDA